MGKNPKCPGYGKDQGEKLKYISSTFINSISIAGSGQHLFDTCQWMLGVSLVYDAHNVGLPTQFLFNHGPESQPIVGSMTVNCVRRWLNPSPTLTERIILLHQRLQKSLDCPPMLLQCWSNVSDDGPTTTQHSVWVTISSQATTQIHWPNCEIMLGHRLRRWANIIPTKTL